LNQPQLQGCFRGMSAAFKAAKALPKVIGPPMPFEFRPARQPAADIFP
jgi:hypothetical protein